LRNAAKVILKNETTIPEEKQVLSALDSIQAAARKIAGMQHTSQSEATEKEDTSPASAILSLDSRPATSSSNIPSSTIDLLSDTAYNLIAHPTVDITAPILNRYVLIQSLLLRPDTFPEVFELYRSKPIPSQSSSGFTFSPPKPDAIATAIPSSIANLALTTSLHTHDLSLALAIIDSSFRTSSYKRSKIFRQALPPITGAALAPFALYTLASSMSHYQNMLPAENFTAIAFAGMLTYTTAIGTIGYVALTTANDQMERVTWSTGMPLWERWVREDERAAIDRVAKGFGFREKWRWGEEAGQEWAELREWIGVKGMVLDAVGLMEGME
jgi:hypothetical protein